MQDSGDEHDEPSPDALAALARLMPALSAAQVEDTENEDAETPEEAEEADEFEYKLFSTTTPGKITITEPVTEEYAVPTRPDSYYRHTPIDPRILQSVVMSGQQVLEASNAAWAQTGRVILVPHEEINKKKRWRPSMARRKKFKAMKIEAEEREKRRLELRSVGRNRGRGRGRGQGSRAGISRDAIKSSKDPAKPSGYPRKGLPAA